METILIHASNETELKLIKEFLAAHRLKNRILSEEDKEDLILAKMMEETDYNATVNTDDFLRQLRS